MNKNTSKHFANKNISKQTNSSPNIDDYPFSEYMNNFGLPELLNFGFGDDFFDSHRNTNNITQKMLNFNHPREKNYDRPNNQEMSNNQRSGIKTLIDNRSKMTHPFMNSSNQQMNQLFNHPVNYSMSAQPNAFSGSTTLRGPETVSMSNSMSHIPQSTTAQVNVSQPNLTQPNLNPLNSVRFMDKSSADIPPVYQQQIYAPNHSTSSPQTTSTSKLMPAGQIDQRSLQQIIEKESLNVRETFIEQDPPKMCWCRKLILPLKNYLIQIC